MSGIEPWIVIAVIGLAGLGALGWFISSGHGWKIRRKAEEFPITTSPRVVDRLREFIWQEPEEEDVVETRARSTASKGT